MIKVDSILIENFRGIRKLQYALDGANLVVKGPNGSGKSGVIDAIEFGLTGNITRLTGVGSSNVSIRQHAPHVDFKDSPELCRVVLDLSLVSGAKFSIERNVANHNQPKITPDNEETRNALSFVSSHPEFSLSRREILKFILTKPGDRAKEVQELLKLDSIGKTRASLNTAYNSAKRSESASKAALDKAKADLLSHLQLSELSKDALLNAANDRRTVVGLTKLTEITPDIKVSEGIASEPKDKKKLINRAESLEKVSSLYSSFDEDWTKASPTLTATAKAIESLESNPSALQSLSLQSFYEKGLSYVDGDHCPLCNKDWDSNELKEHIKNKVKSGQEAAAIKSSIEKGASEASVKIQGIKSDYKYISKVSESLGLESELKDFEEFLEAITTALLTLNRPIENLNELKIVCIGINKLTNKNIKESLNNLKTELEKLPDITAEESAKQYLILADERLRLFRSARSEYEKLKKKSLITGKLLQHFNKVSEEVLANLYDQIESEFSKYYKTINGSDEDKFSAKFSPDDGSLNFDVDFYGRGKFPPNAYHSEGHQDGMGLCLYFALSKRLLNENFRLCLLDDVLMSVDSSHRREVCGLLKTEFKDTQLIITTHDEVWGKQLSIEGIVSSKGFLHFRKWSVNDGPAVWDIGEIWDEMDSYLAENKVPEASGTLRRYLEFLMGELSFKLRANLEARPTANYDLGDLMPAVAKRFKELLKKANEAANSWNQKDIIEVISTISSNFGTRYSETNAEQWGVNASVHYNEWKHLSTQDFQKILDSFKTLLETIKCDDCNSWFYVTPSKGNPENIRCECGRTNFNLKKKQ